MKKNYRLDNNSRDIIIRGCGVKGCCPILRKEGKIITITDDYGNTVKMTKDQWDVLVKKAVKI